mmetsp:Transcript_17503/g.37858  ORF Transcript_17503/g.37858 Transcript_17503/m.37858 type:complete len:284 (-) Transcript_17503:360-1211(-)
MIHPLALCLNILAIVRICLRHNQGDRPSHIHTQCSKPLNLSWIIRNQADRINSHILQYPRYHSVLTCIFGKAEVGIRIHGIEPYVLESVGGYFVRKANATTLLLEIDDCTTIFTNVFERHFKLFFAVTSLTTKDLTREALIMNPHRNHFRTTPLPSRRSKGRLVRAINHTGFTAQSSPGPQRIWLAHRPLKLFNAIGSDAEVTNIGRKVGLGNVLRGYDGIGKSSGGENSFFGLANIGLNAIDGGGTICNCLFRFLLGRIDQHSIQWTNERRGYFYLHIHFVI